MCLYRTIFPPVHMTTSCQILKTRLGMLIRLFFSNCITNYLDFDVRKLEEIIEHHCSRNNDLIAVNCNYGSEITGPTDLHVRNDYPYPKF